MDALKLAALGLFVASCSCCEEACPAWSYPDDGEPGNLQWPFLDGTAQRELWTTYGQAVGDSSALHLGLDVLATAGEAVFALEAGVVKRVEKTGASTFEYGLVVASKVVEGRAFLYMHVVPAVAFAVGQEVEAHDLLGTVANDAHAHVHLSRLGGNFETVGWDKIDSLSERNPLALLDRELLGDETDPVIETISIETIGEGLLVLRSNEDPTTWPKYYPETGLQAGLRDVVARVHDEDGRSGLLAPYALTLSIGGQVQSRLVLDGPLDGLTDALYCLDTQISNGLVTVGVHASKASVLYFELTNGSATGTDPPSKANAWDAAGGSHDLELCVQDVSGNEARASRSVTVANQP